jgi:hypothetical protein
MAHAPTGPQRSVSMLDHLVTCLWWLIFLGGVGAGAAVGIVLALWLTLSPLPGLLLIAACWLVGNAAGWLVATRMAAALTRRIRKGRKRLHAAPPTGPASSHGGFPRVYGTGWARSPWPACP